MTVIVPVYNTKLQIERCVASIRNQTYPELEILLIDDGSTDGSEELCDTFAKEDLRIRVIHKENGGVSSARNEGLTQAAGEYIVFVDSDDWIEADMVEDMLREAKEKKVMLVVGNYVRAVEEGQEKQSIAQVPFKGAKLTEQETEPCLLTSAEILEYYLSEDDNIRIPHSVWGKLFARSLIGDKRFPLIKRTEELLFSTEIFCEAKKGVYLPKKYYHYLDDREESLMHQAFDMQSIEHTVNVEIPLLLKQVQIMEEAGFKEQAEHAAFYLGKRLLYFYLGFRDKMLKAEAKAVTGYARRNRRRILHSLKGDYVKISDKLRVCLFVLLPAAYYRFVLLHDR